MSIVWTLNNGNVVTVEFNYRVLNKNHKIQFYFIVTTDGIISPLGITSFFRQLFLNNVFLDVLSEEFVWVSTKVTHLEGALKLNEEAFTTASLEEIPVETEPIDEFHRLRVSLTRYNKSTPIFFYLYGIRNEPDTKKMASTLLKLCQNDIEIFENDASLGVRFAGLTGSDQVTQNQFVVSILCKKELLTGKQAYKREDSL